MSAAALPAKAAGHSSPVLKIARGVHAIGAAMAARSLGGGESDGKASSILARPCKM
jgi:hypothetical protein